MASSNVWKISLSAERKFVAEDAPEDARATFQVKLPEELPTSGVVLEILDLPSDTLALALAQHLQLRVTPQLPLTGAPVPHRPSVALPVVRSPRKAARFHWKLDDATFLWSQTCVVCMEKKPTGCLCSLSDGRPEHFICTECLANYILSATGPAGCIQREEQGPDGLVSNPGELPCPNFKANACNCGAMCEIKILTTLCRKRPKKLAGKCNDAFHAYLQALRSCEVENFRRNRAKEEEEERREKSERELAEQAIIAAREYGQSLHCPGCGVPAVKDNQCTHIICACRTPWCFLCGRSSREELSCGCSDAGGDAANLEGHPGWTHFSPVHAQRVFFIRMMGFYVHTARKYFSKNLWDQLMKEKPGLLEALKYEEVGCPKCKGPMRKEEMPDQECTIDGCGKKGTLFTCESEGCQTFLCEQRSQEMTTDWSEPPLFGKNKEDPIAKKEEIQRKEDLLKEHIQEVLTQKGLKKLRRSLAELREMPENGMQSILEVAAEAVKLALENGKHIVCRECGEPCLPPHDASLTVICHGCKNVFCLCCNESMRHTTYDKLTDYPGYKDLSAQDAIGEFIFNRMKFNVSVAKKLIQPQWDLLMRFEPHLLSNVLGGRSIEKEISHDTPPPLHFAEAADSEERYWERKQRKDKLKKWLRDYSEKCIAALGTMDTFERAVGKFRSKLPRLQDPESRLAFFSSGATRLKEVVEQAQEQGRRSQVLERPQGDAEVPAPTAAAPEAGQSSSPVGRRGQQGPAPRPPQPFVGELIRTRRGAAEE